MIGLLNLGAFTASSKYLRLTISYWLVKEKYVQSIIQVLPSFPRIGNASDTSH